MAQYYAQRASAGLVIAEGTNVSPQGRGYAFTPGLYTMAQVEAWQAAMAMRFASRYGPNDTGWNRSLRVRAPVVESGMIFLRRKSANGIARVAGSPMSAERKQARQVGRRGIDPGQRRRQRISREDAGLPVADCHISCWPARMI
jgi:hypothetical protein